MTEWVKRLGGRRRLAAVYWGVNIVLGLVLLAFVLR